MPMVVFYVTADNELLAAPALTLRDTVKKAVVAANPSVPPQSVLAGFPQDHRPAESDLLTKDGQRLIEVTYFASGLTDQKAFRQVAYPTVLQLQDQFPGRTVYPANSTDLVRPVRVVLQWGTADGDAKKTMDQAQLDAIQRAVTGAVQEVARNQSLPCDGCTGKILAMTYLMGRFGKHYVEVLFVPDGQNVPSALLNPVQKEQMKNSTEVLVSTDPTPVWAPTSDELHSAGATDPTKVYYYDFAGTPTIFDMAKGRKKFLEAFLQKNEACRTRDCGARVNLLTTEKRAALSDG